MASQLAANEDRVIAELTAAQGSRQDIDGYYMPDPARVAAAMRPSETLNRIVDVLP